jgi:hypothetical protein
MKSILDYLRSTTEKHYIDHFYRIVEKELPAPSRSEITYNIYSYVDHKGLSCDEYNIEASLVQLDLNEFKDVDVEKRAKDFLLFLKNSE